jgi:hypothetical protein
MVDTLDLLRAMFSLHRGSITSSCTDMIVGCVSPNRSSTLLMSIRRLIWTCITARGRRNGNAGRARSIDSSEAAEGTRAHNTF